MISLDILCVGRLERDADGSILVADSTSVLIRADDRLIVVDPSTEYMRPAIKTSFKQIGVFPKDVDTVILTHSHHDHVGNLNLFPKAKVLIHSGGEPIARAEEFDGEELEVCKGVRIVHTPGHCPEECSVFVEADRRYAIAGDTVPLEDNYRQMVPPARNCDRERAFESLKRVCGYADVVVPGHGFPFMTRRTRNIVRIMEKAGPEGPVNRLVLDCSLDVAEVDVLSLGEREGDDSHHAGGRDAHVTGA